MFIRKIITSKDFLPTPVPQYVGQSGQLNWNNEQQTVTIFNGSVVHNVYPGYVTLELTPDNSEALEWVKRKIKEERELDALCEKHPGLKDARDTFEVLKRLCK